MPKGIYKRRGPANNAISVVTIDRIREMILSEDFTLEEISEKLGVGRTTVKNYRDRLGLPKLGHLPQRPKIIDADHMLCRRCKTPRHNDEFIWLSNERKDKRQNICKYCTYAQTNARMANLESFLKQRVSTIRHTCQRDGIACDLTWPYLAVLLEHQRRQCFYTDVELVWGRGSRQTDSRVRCTLDKIEPAKGYVLGNVVWCSRRSNLVKQDLTLEEMREWLPGWWARIQRFKKEHDEYFRLAGYHSSGEARYGEAYYAEGAPIITSDDLQLHAALPV